MRRFFVSCIPGRSTFSQILVVLNEEREGSVQIIQGRDLSPGPDSLARRILDASRHSLKFQPGGKSLDAIGSKTPPRESASVGH